MITLALGGGNYITQNKTLPGAYFQFISRATATATLAERGVAAIALDMKWGADSKIITLTATEFLKDSLKLLGYAYNAPELKAIREILLHSSKLHLYKLTSGGTQATNDYATAVCGGTRGNDLKVVIQKNIDDTSKYDVSLFLGTVKVDAQTVTSAAELVANDFVTYKTDATLTETAGTPLAGGTDGTSDATAHQTFLDKLESFTDTNAIGYVGTDETTKALYVAYAKRMRDEIGIKLQAVAFSKAADSIACVNVKNSADLVPWVTGVVAGSAVNASATNMKYDGEYEVNTDYTQAQLEAAIKAGEFVFHSVNGEVRVLEDINSLVTTTDEQGDVFKDNQTIRVIDSIAVSIASIFATKYIGKVQNNDSGRTSLWSDVVKIHQNLANINAIEGFEEGDIVVEQGESKKSVQISGAITVVNTMTKLYMHTVVS